MSHKGLKAQEELSLQAAAYSTCYQQMDWYKENIDRVNHMISAVRISMEALSPCLEFPNPYCQATLVSLSNTGKSLEAAQEALLLTTKLQTRSNFNQILRKNSLNPTQAELNFLENPTPVRMSFTRNPEQPSFLGPYPLPQKLIVSAGTFKILHHWKFIYRGDRKIQAGAKNLFFKEALTTRSSSAKAKCSLTSEKEISEIQVYIENEDYLSKL